MRSIRKGAISFGMVNVPVKIYAATEDNSVSLRMVHADDGARIRMRRFCSGCDAEVAHADIAKGYEDGDQMTVLTSDDLAALPLGSTHSIEVEAFVAPESVDPMRYGTVYYVEPDKAGVRAYALLREALRSTGRVGVAKVTLRSRERLCLIQVHDDVLDDVIVLTTLLWADEVRDPAFKFLEDAAPVLDAAEVELACALVEAMSDDDLDLDGFTDGYRAALETLIAAKQADNVEPIAAARPDGVGDLVAALDASLDARKAS